MDVQANLLKRGPGNAAQPATASAMDRSRRCSCPSPEKLTRTRTGSSERSLQRSRVIGYICRFKEAGLEASRSKKMQKNGPQSHGFLANGCERTPYEECRICTKPRSSLESTKPKANAKAKRSCIINNLDFVQSQPKPTPKPSNTFRISGILIRPKPRQSHAKATKPVAAPMVRRGEVPQHRPRLIRS